MPTLRRFHIQAGQYREENRKKAAINCGKVVKFLRENPLSTCDEIYKACGVGVGVAQKYVKWVRYNGQVCYRLNHAKIQ